MSFCHHSFRFTMDKETVVWADAWRGTSVQKPKAACEAAKGTRALALDR